MEVAQTAGEDAGAVPMEAPAGKGDLRAGLPVRVALGVDRVAGDLAVAVLAGSPSSGSGTDRRSGRTIL